MLRQDVKSLLIDRFFPPKPSGGGGVVDTVRDVILELGLGGHHEDTLEDNT